MGISFWKWWMVYQMYCLDFPRGLWSRQIQQLVSDSLANHEVRNPQLLHQLFDFSHQWLNILITFEYCTYMYFNVMTTCATSRPYVISRKFVQMLWFWLLQLVITSQHHLCSLTPPHSSTGIKALLAIIFVVTGMRSGAQASMMTIYEY